MAIHAMHRSIGIRILFVMTLGIQCTQALADGESNDVCSANPFNSRAEETTEENICKIDPVDLVVRATLVFRKRTKKRHEERVPNFREEEEDAHAKHFKLSLSP